MAQLYGFDSPAEMVGKTDLDIIEAESARVLMAEEQQIVASGQGFADREELATINGSPFIIFLTGISSINAPLAP